jgi:energy-coupling factor transporter ATP-binding protein EcfA2
MALTDLIIEASEMEAPRILFHGAEGSGKTTLVASIPNSLMIPTEDGFGNLKVRRLPLVTSYDTLMDYLGAVRAGEAGDIAALSIDSVTKVVDLIYKKVCQSGGVASIEFFGGGFGKGYKRSAEIIRNDLLPMLDEIKSTGVAIVLTGHSKVERFEDPEHASYDRMALRLDKDCAAAILEWCDVVGHVSRKIILKQTDSKLGKRNLAGVSGKDGSDRILRVVGAPSCVAKNRYGIADDLPLEWDALVKAMGM